MRVYGIDIRTYGDCCCPEIKDKKNVVDRGQSIEALHRFRKEFQIIEKDYADEGILNRLIENYLDIYKTFSKIFGV